MFDSLSDRLRKTLAGLTGRGRVTEADVDAAMREVRLALLEADVNFKVVRGLVARIRERCVGVELNEALNPAQQVVDIVHQELIGILGGETIRITFAPKPPTVVLMAGLQGSGKTTTAAKLALHLRKHERKSPGLVAADLQRPAAIDQLEQLGRQIQVPVYRTETTDAVTAAREGLEPPPGDPPGPAPAT